MEYKVIDGYAGKYEIGENGTVRNTKTKRETQPYHSSELTGPMVHLLNVRTNEEGRLPALKMVVELFGKLPEGWEGVDVDTLEYRQIVRRARKAKEAADEKAVEAANEIVEEAEIEIEAEAGEFELTVEEVDALLAE